MSRFEAFMGVFSVLFFFVMGMWKSIELIVKLNNWLGKLGKEN